MVWSVKNPVKQKPQLIVEFPYKQRPFGERSDLVILEFGLQGHVFLAKTQLETS
jgi:hypothetical protein